MNWAWQLRLKPTIKFVLMALADAADDEGHCWPSVPTLAHKTCMDERSVQRILKALKDSNFIEVEPRYRNDGSPTSNKYRLALNTTGDKLSPPPRQANREVVTATTPLGGNSVTLTTTEPLVNQKQPQPINKESLNAASFVDALILPRQLTSKERLLAITQLSGTNPIVAQEILDELAARLNINGIKSSPLSYMRSLITRANSGNFTPEAGLKIAHAREQEKLINQSDLAKKSSASSPTNFLEIKKHLSAMHEAIGRKPQLEEQE